MKKLYLLRHAEAQGAADDKSRDLTAAGWRQGESLGLYMLRNHIRPDIILSSDSRRTLMTVEAMGSQWGWNIPLIQSPELYLAPADMLLDVIREQTPQNAQSVLVVAHNPGIAELAFRLAGPRETTPRGFPPGTLAEILYDGKDWGDLSPRGCRAGNVFTGEFEDPAP